ncbi:MAG: glutathione ABC transporter permease [Dehalococcoidia bacterium]|nr:MAG: glutathione ABC transporter permease [Dehalococcoidia bacterium]
MTTYLVRRTVQALVSVFGVMTIVFFVVRLGGDPVALLMPENATDEQRAAARSALGLDQPLHVQYGRFLVSILQGDLGTSLRQGQPALALVLERLPATLELAVASFTVGLAIAFGLGLLLQLSRSQFLRAAVLWLAFARQAVPVFWFGLLLILLFSVKLGWLPSLGREGLTSLVLPALTLGTYELALYVRLLDADLREQLRQDYIRTARAKGVSELGVVLRHALPNALLPIVTIAGINVGVLLSGTVITETVFSWPGVGRLIVQAVHQRDYPVVQAGILVVSLIFVGVNLVVDLLYAAIDPRVRLR